MREPWPQRAGLIDLLLEVSRLREKCPALVRTCQRG
jgi:hypothetical protein